MCYLCQPPSHLLPIKAGKQVEAGLELYAGAGTDKGALARTRVAAGTTGLLPLAERAEALKPYPASTAQLLAQQIHEGVEHAQAVLLLQARALR